VLADITSGKYFGEIAFIAMVKKMLQVPKKFDYVNYVFGGGFACISDSQKSAGPVRSRSHRYRKRHETPLAFGHGAASGEGETFPSENRCKK
jgi:hypothetical protein